MLQFKIFIQILYQSVAAFHPSNAGFDNPEQKAPDFKLHKCLGLGHILNHPLGINSLLAYGIAVKTNLCYYLDSRILI